MKVHDPNALHLHYVYNSAFALRDKLINSGKKNKRRIERPDMSGKDEKWFKIEAMIIDSSIIAKDTIFVFDYTKEKAIFKAYEKYNISQVLKIEEVEM